MARYYFHLHNDVECRDEIGQDFPTLNAAVGQATEYAREMAAASVKELGRIVLHHRIDLEDESGAIVHTVTFGEAVNIAP
jgi:hypothetical protein